MVRHRLHTLTGRCIKMEPDRVRALLAAAVSANSTNALPRPRPASKRGPGKCAPIAPKCNCINLQAIGQMQDRLFRTSEPVAEDGDLHHGPRDAEMSRNHRLRRLQCGNLSTGTYCADSPAMLLCGLTSKSRG
jgi:hypothetical protein